MIFLILSGNTRIFGTFIKSKIEVKHDAYVKDENAFVFSLNNNKIYKILIPEYAMKFSKEYTIIIGNNEKNNGLSIYSRKIHDNLLKEPKIYDFQKSNELTEGLNELQEFEIFEINNN